MKTKKAAAKKSTRKAIPYTRIAKLIEEGWGAVDIATKLDRLTAGADPGHSIRAIISRMRTVGYKNSEGKVVKLKVKRVGIVKPVKKGAVKKAAPKKSVPQVDGKTLAAGVQ
jgi:hypothetical protein